MEHSENGVLAGTDDRLALLPASPTSSPAAAQGGNAVLTSTPRCSETAYKAMAKQTGSVVALNPKTGAIWPGGTPSYDPNLLSSHDSATIQKNYKKLLKDPGDPMLDRAISQTYPPGSVSRRRVRGGAEERHQADRPIQAPTGTRCRNPATY